MSSIYTSIFEKGEVDTAGLVTREKGKEEERKEGMKGGEKKGMVMLATIH